MNDHYYADLEEGEIRELAAPCTPLSNCQKSQWPSGTSITMSSGDCGSSSTSRTTDNIGTPHHFRGNNASGYYPDSDNDSIRSSRPCTPPGLCISKGAVPVPHAPEPVFQTVSSFPGLIRTNLESPTPQPTSSPRFRAFYPEPDVVGSSSEIRDEQNPEPPVVCPADQTWDIPPDVYEKVQSALARVLAMDQAGASSEWDCQQTAGSRQAHTVAEDQVEQHGCHHEHQPPKSPLSPEELERAIGIIEELSVVNGVPPDVFVQSGISPGTLYHAFKHLGHTLERYLEGSPPKSPAPSFCGK